MYELSNSDPQQIADNCSRYTLPYMNASPADGPNMCSAQKMWNSLQKDYRTNTLSATSCVTLTAVYLTLKVDTDGKADVSLTPNTALTGEVPKESRKKVK